MTGKRKTKKKKTEKGFEIPKIIQPTKKTTKTEDLNVTGKVDVLGESVAELFSRVTELEKMFEVLTASAPIEPTVTETDTEIDMRDYVVQEGQTMSMIAKEVYGNAGLFNRIASHNYDRHSELRENANYVEEGWRLRIPPAP